MSPTVTVKPLVWTSLHDGRRWVGSLTPTLTAFNILRLTIGEGYMVYPTFAEARTEPYSDLDSARVAAERQWEAFVRAAIVSP